MQEVAVPLAAAGMGLMGAGHCMSMCGGIVAALSFGNHDDKQKRRLQLGYNFGRIATYALLGGLAAAFTGAVPALGAPLARTFAGILLILLGLHFLGESRGLIVVERVGQGVWRKLKPAASALVPVRHPLQALAAGAVWGWLPCGLVYSALAFAATQGSFGAGAAVMLAFGAGTLPALLLGALTAAKLQKVFRRQAVRRLMAWAYIGFGLWTIAVPWYHLTQHLHHAPNAHETRHPAAVSEGVHHH